MKFLLSMSLALAAFSANGQGFTADDPSKTAVTDGTYVGATNALNYVTAKNQDDWKIVMGTAGGSYAWNQGWYVQTSHRLTIQGADPVAKPTFCFSNFVGNTTAFQVAPTGNGFVTMKDFVFTDAANGPASQIIFVQGTGNCFWLDNITFTNIIHASYSGWFGTYNSVNTLGPYGLVSRCTLESHQAWSSGFFVVDGGCLNHYGWTQPMSWGTTNAVVFEDCWASKTDQGGQVFADGEGAARIVMRNCNFTNFAEVVHGIPDGAGDGTLQVEYYNNHFHAAAASGNITRALWLRGGTAVIFSNLITQSQAGGINTGWHLTVECASSLWASEGCGHQLSYPSEYPGFQQVGRGVVTGTEGNVPVYVWGNTVPSMIGGETALGIDSNDAQFVVQGRDVFTNSVKPGYVPLAYPHPLRNTAPNTNPPSIFSQPASQTVATGSTASFAVSASGASLAYQWRKNLAPLEDSAVNPFVIPNAQPADAGSYTVFISNSFGSVTSSPATLTVTNAPTGGGATTNPSGTVYLFLK